MKPQNIGAASLLGSLLVFCWMVTPGLSQMITAPKARDGERLDRIRVEIFLAREEREHAQVIQKEFAAASLNNLHFQFFRAGYPPPNVGIGSDVPAESAQLSIRLAKEYNRDVKYLLPEDFLPKNFITIGSSAFDETVPVPVTSEEVQQLLDPNLHTEEFHRLYRKLTDTGKETLRPY